MGVGEVGAYKMKVLILTQGTRGDVQPFVALARRLEQAGHEAVLGGPASSTSLAMQHGVRFIPFDDPIRRWMADPKLRELLMAKRRGVRRVKFAAQLARKRPALINSILKEMASAGDEGADIVVHNPIIPGHGVAERLGVPSVPACPNLTWVPTASFPDPRFPFPLPKALNRSSYKLVKSAQLPTKILERMFSGDVIAKWRRETLGLPPRRGHHDYFCQPDGAPSTVLQVFSRHVLPASLDYPAWVHTTGFWFLPASEDWSPTRELSDFLAAGEPPIYVGFGSMVGTDPGRTGRVVAEAIRRARVRAVIVKGWGGIPADEFGEEVLAVDQAPHGWLFPRMAAIVHHGGAGTIAAALASGRAQVVCPFIMDQPLNAHRMHAVGVAPAPQPQRHLTAEGLARAIRQAVTDRSMAARAEELGHQVRAEDGVTAAVKILESEV